MGTGKFEEGPAWFKALMRRVQEGVALTGPDGDFVFVNQAHACMFDYGQPENLLGKSWRILYPPETVEWFQRYVMPRLYSNGVWRGEVDGVSATGRVVQQEVSLTVSEGAGIICVTRDISSRRRDEATQESLHSILRDAEFNARIDRTMHRACHDVANFMSAIEARLTRVRALCTGLPEAIVDLDVADRALRSAQEIARSVMMAQPPAPTKAHPVDIVPLVSRAVTMMEDDEATHPAIQVHAGLASATCEVDPIIFMRALLNLLRNAVEAGGPRAIEVHVQQSAPKPVWRSPSTWRSGPAPEGPSVTISIRDYGRGIGPDIIDKIFNAYFSTKTGVTVANRGLGLDAVMELVGRTRGRISVASSLHEGTQFDVQLPVLEYIPAPPRMPVDRPIPAPVVYVLDDDDESLRACSRALAARGFSVEQFDDPELFLATLRMAAPPPAAAVIDYDYDDHDMTGPDIALLSATLHPDLALICFSSAVDPPRLHAFDSFVAKTDGGSALADALYAHLYSNTSRTGENPPD